ncbi:MAG: hypothetical protein P1U38_08775 [Aeromicrobium sp.]|uniref:hypothetical protein n=1 Tax=Aeromicrobium sp. TaxID=1871063 RepID=UPI0025BD7CA2|nr:hypothetical protein [Aeromicrobium sp.]MCK5891615.1 hypothetical protein [Aeromicrobium sp.]MDF1704855.1 hypothetical protein [Aeromicrobium sp.]
MDALEITWALSFIATAWFLPIGAIRMIAYASGDVDHTSGMRRLAVATLGTGLGAAIVLLALTLAIVLR